MRGAEPIHSHTGVVWPASSGYRGVMKSAREDQENRVVSCTVASAASAIAATLRLK